MYIPKIYKNENQEEIRNFIHENGFAILINLTSGKLWATHIPLLLEKDETGNEILSGHVSIENPQAKSFKDSNDVLVIFTGIHSYISSSWYNHENVPTWNYLAVHVYGNLKVINHQKAVASLKRLVDKYEKNSENPLKIEDLSNKTMLQARAIVAFEITIKSIEAVKKMSQNRDNEDYKKVIAELEKTNDNQAIAVANEMKKCPR